MDKSNSDEHEELIAPARDGAAAARLLAIKFAVFGAAALVVWGLPWVFVDRPGAPLASLILVVGGAYLGFLMPTAKLPSGLWWRRLVGAVYFMVGAFMPWGGGGGAELPWQPYSEAIVAEAKAEGKPVMIDFTAAWCGPCRIMDNQVFSRQSVVDAAERFVALKADMTNSNDPDVQQLGVQYAIQAFPTVIFLGADGEEVTSLRLVGVEWADQFAQRLAAVR